MAKLNNFCFMATLLFLAIIMISNTYACTEEIIEIDINPALEPEGSYIIDVESNEFSFPPEAANIDFLQKMYQENDERLQRKHFCVHVWWCRSEQNLLPGACANGRSLSLCIGWKCFLIACVRSKCKFRSSKEQKFVESMCNSCRWVWLRLGSFVINNVILIRSHKF